MNDNNERVNNATALEGHTLWHLEDHDEKGMKDFTDVHKHLKVNTTACVLCVCTRSHLLVPQQSLQQLQETSAITKV